MITVIVLTISDSGASGLREDASGPAVRQRCRELGWQVTQYAILPDKHDAIQKQLAEWADSMAAQVILTTGGTGVALRDVTPEATAAVLERLIPGLAEVMRSEGRKQTRFASLSRGFAGTRGTTLIVNLPGSPKGAVQSLDAIADLIPHITDLLAGRTEH